jgi:crossover junction endodeoxyribonuclease RuvC
MTADTKNNFLFAIDPSINNTGWSYLFFSPNEEQILLLDSGIISNTTGPGDILEKMRYIFNSLKEKLSLLHVDAIVIEETLVNINPFTSLKLSKGQCAAICGSFLCEKNVYIYSCKSARKTLLNNGNASKQECRLFVSNRLKIRIPNEHIADSIMIGFLHHYRWKNNLLNLPIVVKKKKKNTLSKGNSPETHDIMHPNTLLKVKKISLEKKVKKSTNTNPNEKQIVFPESQLIEPI